MEEWWSARSTASSCSGKVTGMATVMGLAKGPHLGSNETTKGSREKSRARRICGCKQLRGGWPAVELRDGDTLCTNGGGTTLCF